MPSAQGYQGTAGYQDGQGSQNAPAARHSAPGFHLDLRRLSRADQVVGAASLVLFISIFLPWFGVSFLGQSVTADGTTVHGYLVIVLILALILIAYLLVRAGWARR